MKSNSKNVILVPGPLHLFLTSGIYYLYELEKKYNVVLIVSHEYRKNELFRKALTCLCATEIIYIPKQNIFNRHKYYAREFLRLILEYRPAFIFHHDVVQVTLMYLFHYARKHLRHCQMVSFAATMTLLHWRRDFELVVQLSIDEYRAKTKLPHALAKQGYIAKSWLKYFLNYYVLPLFFLRVVFRPGMNVELRRRMMKQWNHQFDYFLLYDEADQRARQEICGSDSGLVKIRHPLTTSGKDLHRKLHPITEKDVVLILPSSVHINQYKNENSYNDEDAVRLFADKWIQIIEILQKKFPGFKVAWKSHPVAGQIVMWVKVVDRIKKLCPELLFLDPKLSAQEWILRSKVIVGNGSSSLWWANLLETKVVVSLDVFGISDVDEMKYRQGVHYFNNLEKLLDADFNKRQGASGNIVEHLPSLLEFTRNTEINAQFQ